jgi:hypothetical protein
MPPNVRHNPPRKSKAALSHQWMARSGAFLNIATSYPSLEHCLSAGERPDFRWSWFLRPAARHFDSHLLEPPTKSFPKLCGFRFCRNADSLEVIAYPFERGKPHKRFARHTVFGFATNIQPKHSRMARTEERLDYFEPGSCVGPPRERVRDFVGRFLRTTEEGKRPARYVPQTIATILQQFD